MVSHQIVEALEIPFECKHADCEFEAPNGQIASHEKKCDYRKVRCPDGRCREDVPLRNLLEHMERGRDVLECNNDGVIVREYYMSKESYRRKYENMNWTRRVFAYQDKHFVMVVERVDKFYYSYLYILADQEEAENYTVTITVGHGGQTEKTHRNGKVFPIDDKHEDILKQRSGVLSFSRGTGDLFEDQDVAGQEKKVVLSFKISRVQG